MIKPTELLHRCYDETRFIFWTYERDEVRYIMRDKDEEGTGGGEDDSQDYSSTETRNNPRDVNDPTREKIEAGKRAPHWYDRIGTLVEENEQRSIENQKLLYRLDFRTVWIARLLLAVIASLLATILTQLFIL